MERISNFNNLHQQFLNRWSPRRFSNKPVKEDDLNVLIEAARWAPSCYNEQPWIFYLANSQKRLEDFCSCLVEANQSWARSAPLLGFLIARKKFLKNNKENQWSDFDCGSAWMSFALQATHLGLYTHAMAGFKTNKTFEILKLNPEEHKIMIAFAVGYKEDKNLLSENDQKTELPSNNRKALNEIHYLVTDVK